jgi:hypothetical protein
LGPVVSTPCLRASLLEQVLGRATAITERPRDGPVRPLFWTDPNERLGGR